MKKTIVFLFNEFFFKNRTNVLNRDSTVHVFNLYIGNHGYQLTLKREVLCYYIINNRDRSGERNELIKRFILNKFVKSSQRG